MRFQYPLPVIPNGYIKTPMLGVGSVTAPIIADSAVIAQKIAALAVQTANIADQAVVNGKLGAGSVTTSVLADLAVATGKLADLAVITAKLADGSVATTKIANAAIVNALIANLAVGTAQLQTGSITTALIQSAAITDALIANVAAGKITAGTIAAAIELTSATITGALIRTAASGQRWELSSPAGVNKLVGYSGASGETNPGELSINANPFTIGTWIRLKAADFSLPGPLLDLVNGIMIGGVGRYAELSNIDQFKVDGALAVTGALSATGTITGTLAAPSWLYPTLQNGWVNNGAGWQPARYTKDAQGFVHLEGLIAGGTWAPGTILFNLNGGYRPANYHAFTTVDKGTVMAAAEIWVSPGGDVAVNASTASGGNTYLSLDGISFATN